MQEFNAISLLSLIFWCICSQLVQHDFRTLIILFQCQWFCALMNLTVSQLKSNLKLSEMCNLKKKIYSLGIKTIYCVSIRTSSKPTLQIFPPTIIQSSKYFNSVTFKSQMRFNLNFYRHMCKFLFSQVVTILIKFLQEKLAHK